MTTRNYQLEQNSRTLVELTTAVSDLQSDVADAREDSIRIKTILELKFPKTAQRVEDVFPDER